MPFIIGMSVGRKTNKMDINYNRYLEICRGAVKDARLFNNFKNQKEYVKVLEHVTYEQGLAYLNYIKSNFPYILDFMEKIAENDKIGNPRKFWYKEIDMFMSPTTLRYSKVLVDLIENFGRLDGLDIVEIGCGYGGQCAVIHDFSIPASYTLVDLPDVLLLAEKFLKKRGIEKVILNIPQEVGAKKYDLCISNYAFTELTRDYQQLYNEKIIQKSRMGYMTCNYFGQRKAETAMTKKEVLSLKDNHKILPEVPLTAPNNLIYIWK